MKRFLLFVTTLLWIAINADGQRINMASGYYEGGGYTYVSGLQIDQHSDYLIAVGADSLMVFGTDSFLNPTSGFVACVDSNGHYKWAQPAGMLFGSNNRITTPEIVCDHGNHVYVLGVFDSVTRVGDTTLHAPYAGFYYWNSFLARFNTDGTLEWVKIIASNFMPMAITQDVQQNIIITGYSQVGAIFDTTHIPWDIIVAKYDTFGNTKWAKGYGAYGPPFYWDEGLSVSTDYACDIYLGGWFENTLTFDSVTLLIEPWDSLQDGGPGFIAKFDANGKALWAEDCGGWCNAVAADSAGNCYAGGYGADVPIDTTSLKSSPYNWYVAKFNPSGKVEWIKYDSTEAGGGIGGLAVDKYGNCYATGWAADSFHMVGYNNQTELQCLRGQQENIAFTFAVDPTGNLLWLNGPCNSSASGSLIAVNNCNIAVAGTYTPPLSIDTFVLPIMPADTLNYVHTKIFVMALDSCGPKPVNTAIEQLPVGLNLDIYPNPNNGSFTLFVTAGAQGPVNLELLDITGRLVDTRQLQQGNNYFNMQLAAGIYLARAEADGKSVVRKISIQ